MASESGAHFIHIAGPEVISKYYGESEQKLREIFDEARENAPSIIFIDELDSIAPRREEVTGEVERRVVAQLLTMMDGLEERGQVVVIGATNRVDAIDAALRRPGRFDREIEIGVPSEPDRIEIMKIHTRGMPLAEDVNLDTLAQQTHGFVGADLAALAREAAIRALRRYLPDLDLDAEEIPQDVLDTLKVYASDFRSAQRDVGPSAMREVMLEVSHVKWQNVGGLDAAKIEVREAIELPLKDRQRIDDLGIEPPRGILLYGPPGTGKTLIAKAVASESGANFIPVRGPQLLSKWVGESERAVREIFKKARQVAPSIIFFDELDALAPERGRSSDSHVLDNVLNQILTEMDGLIELKDVVIMGATNRPEMVDPALLRAGRFDRLVYIGEPAFEDRKQIIAIHTRFMPLEGSSLEEIVTLMAQYNEDAITELVEKLGKDKTVTADDDQGLHHPGAGEDDRHPGRHPAEAPHRAPGRAEPDLCRPGPGRSCRRPRGRNGRLRGIGPRSPLPGGRHACPPRRGNDRVPPPLRRGAGEGPPDHEREPPGVLRQDPAALQGRASAESAAAGVPVKFFLFYCSVELLYRDLTLQGLRPAAEAPRCDSVVLPVPKSESESFFPR